jgi:hypothetical protein
MNDNCFVETYNLFKREYDLPLRTLCLLSQLPQMFDVLRTYHYLPNKRPEESPELLFLRAAFAKYKTELDPVWLSPAGWARLWSLVRVNSDDVEVNALQVQSTEKADKRGVVKLTAQKKKADPFEISVRDEAVVFGSSLATVSRLCNHACEPGDNIAIDAEKMLDSSVSYIALRPIKKRRGSS